MGTYLPVKRKVLRIQAGIDMASLILGNFSIHPVPYRKILTMPELLLYLLHCKKYDALTSIRSVGKRAELNRPDFSSLWIEK